MVCYGIVASLRSKRLEQRVRQRMRQQMNKQERGSKDQEKKDGRGQIWGGNGRRWRKRRQEDTLGVKQRRSRRYKLKSKKKDCKRGDAQNVIRLETGFSSSSLLRKHLLRRTSFCCSNHVAWAQRGRSGSKYFAHYGEGMLNQKEKQLCLLPG